MNSSEIQSPFIQLINSYKLLQMEYEYEKELFYRSNKKNDIQRKIKEGNAWYPLQYIRSYYNSLNQPVIEFKKTEINDIDNNFEHGRPVNFFTLEDDRSIHHYKFICHVSYVSEERIVLVLPDFSHSFDLQRVKNLGIQVHFDNTSYVTMLTALKDVMSPQTNRLSELREIILGKAKPEERQIPSLKFMWLNNSQQKAVNKVLRAKDIAIVHGPPGTGKTTTLVEAIHETLRRENQVMVCAQSNTAVDWISEKLVDRGIDVLRVGNPTKVNNKMLSFTYERLFSTHELYNQLKRIRTELRSSGTRLKQANITKREAYKNHIRTIRNKAIELEIKINHDIFSKARVVACTLIGSANKILNGKRFSSLFIDEAAQALEPACWVSILKADRVIFAGDPCQLPPTIKCYEASRQGLNKTMLEKLINTKNEAVTMLETQYRMHEDIMKFPSIWFYNERLQAAPEVKYRSILQWENAIEWYDTKLCDFNENTDYDKVGRINKPEAELLIEQLAKYVEKIGIERILEERIDFGIISPYRLQTQYLRSLVKRNKTFKPIKYLIAINTVDGFQGQERDVILMSLVRANEQGNIGFLNDLRRMNVAITRARMKVMILADSSTLTRHNFYKSLYDYISDKGRIVNIEPVK